MKPFFMFLTNKLLFLAKLQKNLVIPVPIYVEIAAFGLSKERLKDFTVLASFDRFPSGCYN